MKKTVFFFTLFFLTAIFFNSVKISFGQYCTTSSACAANTCLGSTCSDSCGNVYNGTKKCAGQCTSNADCSCPPNSCSSLYCENLKCTSTCDLSTHSCTQDDGCTPNCSLLKKGYGDLGAAKPDSTYIYEQINCGGNCKNSTYCGIKKDPSLCNDPTVCVGDKYPDQYGDMVCDGTKPRVCDPAETNVCSGKTYKDTCGGFTCQGTLGPDCSSASNYWNWQTYSSPNGCGQCTGTKVPVCDSATAINTCSNQKFNDSSGKLTCTGTKTGDCGDTTKVASGQTYADSCGVLRCTGTGPDGCDCSAAANNCINKTYSSTTVLSKVACTCNGTKPADCSDSVNYCSGTNYNSVNGCGICTGSGSGTCDSSKAGNYCTTQKYANSCGGMSCSGSVDCTKSCLPTQNCPAACGYTGGTVPDGSCGEKSCPATASCLSLSSLDLLNESNAMVSADGGNRNQICQPQFTNRNVQFKLVLFDAAGANKINKVSLVLNNYMTATVDNITTTPAASINGGNATFYGQPTSSASGNNLTVIFPINFPDNFQQASYKINVYAEDGTGAGINGGTAAVYTNRDLKVWDCHVAVSGTVYDGSAGMLCPTDGYTTSAGTKANLISLNYVNSADGSTVPMTVVSSEASYQSGSNYLIWGKKYTPQFNYDVAFSTSTDQLRLTDLSSNTQSCPGGIVLDVGNSAVSPYVDSPSFKADYSAIVDQASWFQVAAGGVISSSSIKNYVPPTCGSDLLCSPAVAISSSDVAPSYPNNGIVSASEITGCDSNGCKNGIPNNWRVLANVLRERFSYQYFYQSYYGKYNQGSLVSDQNKTDYTMDDVNKVATTGVIFVNGNLSINQDNPLPSDKFLMVVVKGNILVSNKVNEVNGIFLSDGSITATGFSDTALTINGLLYSPKSDINLSRGFSKKSENNNKPAVIINYRPELVFLMPGKLSRILSGWSEGN